MERDFLAIYNGLKIKMFYGTVGVFIVRFLYSLFSELSDKNQMIFFVNLAILIVIVLDTIYLAIKKNRLTIATLIMLYAVALKIFISYLISADAISIHFFVARDLVTINVLVLIAAFMLGRFHTIILSVFLIISFILITVIPQNHLLDQYIFNIILFLIAGCFIYLLLSNLIEKTLKVNIEALKEIEQLSEFKQNVIRLIFHDLKVPVHSIIDLSNSGKDDNSKKINYYAENIKKQLENVLDVERLEEPEIKLDFEQHNIHDIIKQAVKSIEIMALQKNIQINTVYHCAGTILCDGALIERTIVNLLSNAIRYSFPNKVILVELSNDSQSVIISVKDKGIGIKTEHLDKIFDKYYIVDSKMSKSNSSNGLGLTFCKLAVTAHKGTIEVHSGRNEGTEFIIKLPGFTCKENVMQSEQTSLRKCLDSNEQAILKPLCEKIKTVPVFKIGEIIPQIKEYEKNENPCVKLWVEQLTDAVYAGDNENFNLLIDEVLNTKQ